MREIAKAATATLILLAAVLVGNAACARTVTVGVVRDGPSRDDALLPMIQEELGRLSDADIVFKQPPEFDAAWDGSRAGRVVEAALADGEVDIILGIGSLVVQEAARDGLMLSKPFVSSFVQRADIPRMPYAGGDEVLKDNLSLIVIPERVERDVEALRRIVPFERLHIAIDDVEGEHLEDLRAALDAHGARMGFELEVLGVPPDPAAFYSLVGDDVEVVYLTGMPRLSMDLRRDFIEGLTARGIPTFSMMGHPDVELGALAALTPDISRQVARRVALNISRLIRGESTANLPVLMSVDTKVWINGRTAVAVGYEPDFEASVYARFLYPEAFAGMQETLTLEQAFTLAEQGNTSLSIKDADVESSYRNKQRSLSPMLPQITGGASYLVQEPLVSSPLIFDNQTTAGIKASQMIFDDRLISDYRTLSRLHESSEMDREIARLDVLSEAGLAYLNLALANVLLRIDAQNVRLTEDNLDLSRVRYDAGQAGKDEVFRWEAELAQRRASMLNTNTSVESSRIALNQALGVDQDTRWTVREYDVDVDEMELVGVLITEMLRTPADFRRLRDVMVELAEENAPELKYLDNLIAAGEIQVGQRKRRFLLPSLAASFSYDYYLDSDPEIDEGRDDTYRVELSAAYPLFNGGDRYQDLKLQQSEVEKLRRERELARQRVEQRTRTALRRIEGSFPSIRLAAEAAASSRLNLDVVKDKYAQGIVNITELLDAQNQNFITEQSEAATVYAFLSDLVILQRAVSWFEFEHDDEEVSRISRRIREAMGRD
jgi:outer membrane protein TolC